MAPRPSLIAAVQYMFDMRHTAWGVPRRPALPERCLQDKVALVTGGTGGIGLAAAQALAAAGCEVHITGRSVARGEAAVASAASDQGKLVFHQADLSSLDAARHLERTILAALGGRSLDLLVQNLACMPDQHEIAPGGHERTLSTNLIVFHFLGKALHPRMSEGGRVINVVSAGHHLHRLSASRLRDLDEPAGHDPIFAYCITHRARVLLTQRWAQAHPHLQFASVHPGWVDTDGLRSAKPMSGFYGLMRRTLRTPAQGADTIAWLAAPETRIESGSYMWDRAVRRVDLPFSGTKASAADVDEVLAFLESI
jgi:dehydrogenase/reductase SDR family protein 12